MADPSSYCENLVREADRDRFLATLFAPAEHRGALFALYAFDIELSRVRDLAREPMPGEIRLQWWREVVEGVRDGEAAAHPVASALLEAIARYGLSRETLIDMIEARGFDIYDDPMGRVAELEGYATKTSGALFDLGARVLGGDAHAAAAEAGIVEGFIDVLLNLPRHASRRQLYLPLEILDRYGATREDAFSGKATATLRVALADLRQRAREHLAKAGSLIVAAPMQVLPAFLPLAPLALLLARLERHDDDPLHPPELPAWRRQWRIWRAARNPKRIAG